MPCVEAPAALWPDGPCSASLGAWLHACRCKEAAEAAPPSLNSPFARSSAQSSAASARRLGLHYLQRYFFLICFLCYLAARSSASQAALGLLPPSFVRWMSERHELKHLLSTLSLETAA